MQEKKSNILIKIFWQFVIVFGIGMSAYGQDTDQYNSDQSTLAFQNENLDLGTFQFQADNKNHFPFHNSPAEESSSNEENGEEENEETNDSEIDGELSHYQLDSSLNPYTDTQAFIDLSKVHEGYNIPLYILFHCWKNFIS